MTGQRTLAVDVGGTGIKAMVFDEDGGPLCDATRIATPYPCPPERLVGSITSIARTLPHADRLGVGFPGLIRADRVVWVNSLTRMEPGGPADPDLSERWTGYSLQDAISGAVGLPTLVANDADVHALASINGSGMECVVTLGTGLGFSLVLDGRLLPHLEFGGVGFGDGRDYDAALGQGGLEADGLDAWLRHVHSMVASLRSFVYFDHLYLGGGNARLIDANAYGPGVTTVGNVNGLLGGHLLWASQALRQA